MNQSSNELPNSPAGLMHLMPSKAEEIKTFAVNPNFYVAAEKID